MIYRQMILCADTVLKLWLIKYLIMEYIINNFSKLSSMMTQHKQNLLKMITVRIFEQEIA